MRFTIGRIVPACVKTIQRLLESSASVYADEITPRRASRPRNERRDHRREAGHGNRQRKPVMGRHAVPSARRPAHAAAPHRIASRKRQSDRIVNIRSADAIFDARG
ncbi:hypothetical protein [Burkholderia sp. BCC1977]|uniref:hypothetical protein n=1 Tax=Burkholderia sp. BCC1977 TaxID=2817440 RepID=UPI002ABE2645|nr:hypothetical protein [Burkholderia sp. BCC1977]